EAEDASPADALTLRRGAGAAGAGFLEAADAGRERTPAGEGAAAELRFELPAAGVYTLWGRTAAPDDERDSFWIRVNGGRWVRWNGLPRGREWQWSTVHDGDGPGAEPLQLALPAG